MAFVVRLAWLIVFSECLLPIGLSLWFGTPFWGNVRAAPRRTWWRLLLTFLVEGWFVFGTVSFLLLACPARIACLRGLLQPGPLPQELTTHLSLLRLVTMLLIWAVVLLRGRWYWQHARQAAQRGSE